MLLCPHVNNKKLCKNEKPQKYWGFGVVIAAGFEPATVCLEASLEKNLKTGNLL